MVNFHPHQLQGLAGLCLPQLGSPALGSRVIRCLLLQKENHGYRDLPTDFLGKTRPFGEQNEVLGALPRSSYMLWCLTTGNRPRASTGAAPPQPEAQNRDWKDLWNILTTVLTFNWVSGTCPCLHSLTQVTLGQLQKASEFTLLSLFR